MNSCKKRLKPLCVVKNRFTDFCNRRSTLSSGIKIKSVYSSRVLKKITLVSRNFTTFSTKQRNKVDKTLLDPNHLRQRIPTTSPVYLSQKFTWKITFSAETRRNQHVEPPIIRANTRAREKERNRGVVAAAPRARTWALVEEAPELAVSRFPGSPGYLSPRPLPRGLAAEKPARLFLNGAIEADWRALRPNPTFLPLDALYSCVSVSFLRKLALPRSLRLKAACPLVNVFWRDVAWARTGGWIVRGHADRSFFNVVVVGRGVLIIGFV